MTVEDPLPERLAAATAELAAARQAFETQAVTNERRMAANRRMTVWALRAGAVAMLVALVGVTVGIVGAHDRAVSTRDTNAKRVASCLQFNVQQRNQRDAEVAESHDFVAALVGTAGSTPQAERLADSFNTNHDRLIRNSHADRDCTPAGIAKYLSTPTTKGP